MAIARREFLAGLAAAGGASVLGRVGLGAAQQQPAQGRDPGEQWYSKPRKFKYSKPIIDAHYHWYPPEFIDVMVKEGAKHGVKISGPDEEGSYRANVGEGAGYAGGGGSTFRKEMRDFTIMFAQMDDRDVDMYVLTMTHPHLNWAPPEFGLRLAQVYNDANSAAAVKYPKRLIGSMLLPYQAPKLAVQEMERAAKLPGMRAAQMAENINGKNLHVKELWPIYEAAESLNLPILLKNINPMHFRLEEEDFSMTNFLGNPFEATTACTALMMGGVLDAFPKLDFYLPHAGGFFPFVTPRIDHAMRRNRNADQFKNMKQPLASDYRRRFHYDLILHSPELMRDLIDLVGADRVTSGTDYPQGMAVMQPVDYVEAIPGITQREAELILCENPARLLRMS
jgi:aminocarboxymuconate-semialdehyde decarboxylase